MTMRNDAPPTKLQEAQARALLEEFRGVTGKAARSMEEAAKWFAGLPLAARDRVGRRMNDPGLVGWYLQTPQIP
jgi:hypothetical protein